MLSYLHAFHAGNHADILKHMALIQILQKLNQKEAPYSFFDTHAGSGLYSLQGEKALKTGEAQKGISKLFSYCENFQAQERGEPLPLAVKNYLEAISPFLAKDLYPGSPLIERAFLKENCFHSICELHPSEFEKLKENCALQESSYNFGPAKKFVQSQAKKIDGFKNLMALTPPAIKRGAALIDPSYEEVSDYKAVEKTIVAVHKKWSAGIIMIWFPLLAHRSEQIEGMLAAICAAAKKQNANANILRADFCVDSPQSHTETSLENNAAQNQNSPRLYGSGILVLNSPWKLDQELEEALKFLKESGAFEKAPSYSVMKI